MPSLGKMLEVQLVRISLRHTPFYTKTDTIQTSIKTPYHQDKILKFKKLIDNYRFFESVNL